MDRIKKFLKWALPVAVSAALLGYLFSRPEIDLARVQDHMTGRVLGVLGVALLFYGAATLWLEALALVRLASGTHLVLKMWTAARIKAASYLLYIVNYALGAGAMTVLLKRRTGSSLSDSFGLVGLIAAFDMGILFMLAAVTAALTATEANSSQMGILGLLGASVVVGLVILRTPRSLGPLDRIRDMTLFQTARHTSLPLLLEIGAIRAVFVLCFMTLAWFTILAFEIEVPLGDAILNVTLVAVISTLPIAVAGLGTGTMAFVEVFKDFADEGKLTACSLAFSFGLIILRAGLGFVFSQEYVREALRAAREGEM